jgi:hypothetical protein
MIMKLFNNIYMKVSVIVLVLLASCTDETRIPEPIKAANVRIQFGTAEDQNFNFAVIETAQIKYSIFSENKNIESVELTFMYNNALTGIPEGPFVLKTYGQQDFDNNNGAIRDEVFSSNQLAIIMGKTGFADLNGGDSFVFANKTTLTDGRVYPAAVPGGNNNITPGIAVNAATEQFSVGWTSYVSCPIDVDFSGTYTLSTDLCANADLNGDGTVEGVPGPGPAGITGPVILTSLGGPVYKMAGFTMYGAFANREINILLVCDNVIVPNQIPGLACANGPVLMNTAVSGAGTYDPGDNATLTFSIDYLNPACSGGGLGCTMTLTRQ